LSDCLVVESHQAALGVAGRIVVGQAGKAAAVELAFACGSVSCQVGMKGGRYHQRAARVDWHKAHRLEDC
jgi:hypothetical protein